MVPRHVLLQCTCKGAKLLAALTSAVEWYKSCVHISFLSEVIQNYVCTYVTGSGKTQYINSIVSIITCVCAHKKIFLQYWQY